MKLRLYINKYRIIGFVVFAATCLHAHLYATTDDPNCLFGMICGIVVYTIHIFKKDRIS